jgi:hypothetical protein
MASIWSVQNFKLGAALGPPPPRRVRQPRPSGALSRTLDQKVFEDKLALPSVERTTAANASQFAIGRRPWRGFKADNLVLCATNGAMEQRRERFGHAQGFAFQRAYSWENEATSSQFRTILTARPLGPMSALGHKRTLGHVRAMSALPQKPDTPIADAISRKSH